MASKVAAGKAMVTLMLDDQFSVGLNNAKKSMKAFGADILRTTGLIVGIGGAIAAPFAYAIKKFEETGGAIDDMAQRTKMGAESLSALKFVADASGQSLESVEGVIVRISKMMMDAKRGVDKAKAGFTGLGLSVKELNNMNADDRFNAIVKALNNIEDPMKRAEAAMKFFGPGLSGSILAIAENFDKLKNTAKEMGLILSSKDIETAAKLGESFDVLVASFDAAVMALGAELAPEIEKTIKDISKMIGEFVQWFSANKDMVTMLAKLGAELLAVAGIVKVLSVAYKGLISVGKSVDTMFKSMGLGSMETIKEMENLRKKMGMTSGEFNKAFGVGSSNLIKMDKGLKAVMDTMAVVGVAIAGWDFGKQLGQILELDKRFQKFFADVNQKTNTTGEILSMTEGELYLAQLKMIDDQLKRNDISTEEYLRRIKSLNEASLKRVLAEPEKNAAVLPTGEIVTDQKLIEQSKQNILDTEKEALALIYEGARLKEKEIELEKANAIAKLEAERQAALIAADGFANAEEMRSSTIKQYAEAITATNNLYRGRLELLAADQQREEIANKIATAEKISTDEAARKLEFERRSNEFQESKSAEIADLELELSYKGYELEKKKLDLAQQRALLAAPEGSLDLVLKEYELRNKILQAEEAAATGNDLSSIGSFSTTNLSKSFGVNKSADKTATNTGLLVEETKKTNKLIKSNTLSFN
jgi:hypothetical protein